MTNLDQDTVANIIVLYQAVLITFLPLFSFDFPYPFYLLLGLVLLSLAYFLYKLVMPDSVNIPFGHKIGFMESYLVLMGISSTILLIMEFWLFVNQPQDNFYLLVLSPFIFAGVGSFLYQPSYQSIDDKFRDDQNHSIFFTFFVRYMLLFFYASVIAFLYLLSIFE